MTEDVFNGKVARLLRAYERRVRREARAGRLAELLLEVLGARAP